MADNERKMTMPYKEDGSWYADASLITNQSNSSNTTSKNTNTKKGITGNKWVDNIGGGVVGALAGGLGDAATFAGLDSVGNYLNDVSEDISSRLEPKKKAELSWDYILSPEGLGRSTSEASGSLAAIALPTLFLPGGTVGTVGRVLTRIPAVGKYLMNPRVANLVATGLISSPMEAAMEGGNYLRRAREMGMNPDTARLNSFGVFGKNAPFLAASNALQFGTFGRLIRPGMSLRARIGAGLGELASQGLEEGMQEGFQNQHFGNPYTYNPIRWFTDPRYSSQQEAVYEGIAGFAAPTTLGVAGGHIADRGNRTPSNRSQNNTTPPPAANGANNRQSNSISQIDAFMGAISGQESGGSSDPYNLVNRDSGARGKFQFMPSTWSEYAEKAGLGANAPMTAENQEKVARYNMSRLYQEYGNWRDVAIAWYAGEGEVRHPKRNRDVKQGKYPSINEYADSVMRRYDRIIGNSSNRFVVEESQNNDTRNGRIFGVEDYNMPTQGDRITAQVRALNPAWQTVIPQIGGVLKNKFGLNAVISSAARTPEHNRAVGGVENSHHRTDATANGGDALDIVLPDGITSRQAEEVRKYFKETGMFKEVLFHDVGSGYHLHLGGLQAGNQRVTQPQQRRPTNRFVHIAQEVSKRTGIPADIIYGQMTQETGGLRADGTSAHSVANEHNNFAGIWGSARAHLRPNKNRGDSHVYDPSNNDAEFIEDYAAKLNQERYTNLKGVTDPYQFALNAYDDRYYTASHIKGTREDKARAYAAGVARGQREYREIVGNEAEQNEQTRNDRENRDNNQSSGTTQNDTNYEEESTPDNTTSDMVNSILNEESRPIFDLDAQDEVTKNIYDEYVENKRYSAQNEAEEMEIQDFFADKINSRGKFINNEENRRAVAERYGQEIEQYGQERLAEARATQNPAVRPPERNRLKNQPSYIEELKQMKEPERRQRGQEVRQALEDIGINFPTGLKEDLNIGEGLERGYEILDALVKTGHIEKMPEFGGNRETAISENVMKRAVGQPILPNIETQESEAIKQTEKPIEETRKKEIPSGAKFILNAQEKVEPIKSTPIETETNRQIDNQQPIDIRELNKSLEKLRVEANREYEKLMNGNGETIKKAGQRLTEIGEAIRQKEAQIEALRVQEQEMPTVEQVITPMPESQQVESEMPVIDENELDNIESYGTVEPPAERNEMIEMPESEVERLREQEIEQPEIEEPAFNNIIEEEPEESEEETINQVIPQELRRPIEIEEERQQGQAIQRDNPTLGRALAKQAQEYGVELPRGLVRQLQEQGNRRAIEMAQAAIQSAIARGAIREQPQMSKSQPTESERLLSLGEERSRNLQNPAVNGVTNIEVGLPVENQEEIKQKTPKNKKTKDNKKRPLISKRGNKYIVDVGEISKTKQGQEAKLRALTILARKRDGHRIKGTTRYSFDKLSDAYKFVTRAEIAMEKDEAKQRFYKRAKVEEYPILKSVIDSALEEMKTSRNAQGIRESLRALENLSDDQKALIAIETLDKLRNGEKATEVQNIMNRLSGGEISPAEAYNAIFDEVYGQEDNQKQIEAPKASAGRGEQYSTRLDLPEGYKTESGRTVDESASSEFILDKEGNKDFGEISEDIEKATDGIVKAAPIRLQVGDQNFGYIHLTTKHLEQLKRKGFDNAIDYVKHILRNFNQIYDESYTHKTSGKEITRFILYCKDDSSSGYMPIDLELEKSNDEYYTIVTAYPRKSKKVKGEPVYDGSPTHPSTAAVNGARLEDINNTDGVVPTRDITKTDSLNKSITKKENKGNTYRERLYNAAQVNKYPGLKKFIDKALDIIKNEKFNYENIQDDLDILMSGLSEEELEAANERGNKYEWYDPSGIVTKKMEEVEELKQKRDNKEITPEEYKKRISRLSEIVSEDAARKNRLFPNRNYAREQREKKNAEWWAKNLEDEDYKKQQYRMKESLKENSKMNEEIEEKFGEKSGEDRFWAIKKYLDEEVRKTDNEFRISAAYDELHSAWTRAYGNRTSTPSTTAVTQYTNARPQYYGKRPDLSRRKVTENKDGSYLDTTANNVRAIESVIDRWRKQGNAKTSYKRLSRLYETGDASYLTEEERKELEDEYKTDIIEDTFEKGEYENPETGMKQAGIKFNKQLPRAEYQRIEEIADEYGGYYYQGGKMILFGSKEDRDGFINDVEGNTSYFPEIAPIKEARNINDLKAVFRKNYDIDLGAIEAIGMPIRILKKTLSGFISTFVDNGLMKYKNGQIEYTDRNAHETISEFMKNIVGVRHIKGELVYDESSNSSTVATDGSLMGDTNNKGGVVSPRANAKTNSPTESVAKSEQKENKKPYELLININGKLRSAFESYKNTLKNQLTQNKFVETMTKDQRYGEKGYQTRQKHIEELAMEHPEYVTDAFDNPPILKEDKDIYGHKATKYRIYHGTKTGSQFYKEHHLNISLNHKIDKYSDVRGEYITKFEKDYFEFLKKNRDNLDFSNEQVEENQVKDLTEDEIDKNARLLLRGALKIDTPEKLKVLQNMAKRNSYGDTVSITDFRKNFINVLHPSVEVYASYTDAKKFSESITKMAEKVNGEKINPEDLRDLKYRFAGNNAMNEARTFAKALSIIFNEGKKAVNIDKPMTQSERDELEKIKEERQKRFVKSVREPLVKGKLRDGGEIKINAGEDVYIWYDKYGFYRDTDDIYLDDIDAEEARSNALKDFYEYGSTENAIKAVENHMAYYRMKQYDEQPPLTDLEKQEIEILKKESPTWKVIEGNESEDDFNDVNIKDDNTPTEKSESKFLNVVRTNNQSKEKLLEQAIKNITYNDKGDFDNERAKDILELVEKPEVIKMRYLSQLLTT